MKYQKLWKKETEKRTKIFVRPMKWKQKPVFLIRWVNFNRVPDSQVRLISFRQTNSY